MTGAPSGVLVAVAVLAVVVAAVLSAGETALLRLGRSQLAEVGACDRPGPRRLRRLMADPHAAAAAAAWVRVLGEVVAAVTLTLALAAAGLAWWLALALALALALVLVGAVAVGVVRDGPRTPALRHPLGAGIATPGALAVAQVTVPRTEMITLPAGTTLGKAPPLFLRSGYSRVAGVDTSGGLLAKALGKVPLSGSSAEVGGLVLTADQVEGRRRRVATLVAARASAQDEDPAPQDAAAPTQGAPR